MRFYFRTGHGSGVSVGLFGALLLGLILAVAWFYLAVIVGAVLVVAGVYAGGRALARRRRR